MILNSMKSLSFPSILFFVLFLSACNDQLKLPVAMDATANPMSGEWLTPCLDMGGGAINQIYAKFENNKSYVAVLSFANVGCSGAYTMTDSVGNPITEPAYTNDVEERIVNNIPDGMHAFTITQISDMSVMNILIYFNGNSFTELVSAAAFHGEWADWLSEPDVAGFAAAPETYIPTGGGMTLQFSRGSLP